LLSTTMSRFEEAAEHFDHALEMNARIRSPLWVAHTQYEYARMLLLRDRADDRERSLGLLEEAGATAQGLGLKALADRVRPLRLQAEAAASR
jgi:tetratricopeptide (TPR) repeat protein